MRLIAKFMVICFVVFSFQTAFASNLDTQTLQPELQTTKENTNILLDGEAYLEDLVQEAGGTLSGNTVTINDVTKTLATRYVNGRIVVSCEEFDKAFTSQSTINDNHIIDSKKEVNITKLYSAKNTIKIKKAAVGERGQNIINIQDALKKAECWINVDGTPSNVSSTGYFGKITKASMIKFQKEQMGLEDSDLYYSNGRYCGCGPKTATALTQVLDETWVDKYGGLFLDTDFKLRLSVVQMISYYDDVYIQAGYAYELGLIESWGYKALKELCKKEANKLRESNQLDSLTEKSTAWDFICTIGGLMPYAGIMFDVLGNTTTVYAASLGEAALSSVKYEPNYLKITDAMARNLKARHTVYELYDPVTNKVKYIGRTRQSLLNRKKQHWYTDINKKGLEIRTAQLKGKVLENLHYKEVRGLEYKVFEKYENLYGGYNNKKFLNKIKPLNISKSKATECLEAAAKFLKRAL